MKKIYTMLYACLDCRKVFKKPQYELGEFGAWESIDQDRICPQCGHQLFRTGVAFKAPKQTDKKNWDRVAPFLRSGHCFNPDFGSPFKEAAAVKTPRPMIPKSEFRKPSRKRNRVPNKTRDANGDNIHS